KFLTRPLLPIPNARRNYAVSGKNSRRFSTRQRMKSPSSSFWMKGLERKRCIIFDVAQTSSLAVSPASSRHFGGSWTICGLETRDTADWKSALHSVSMSTHSPQLSPQARAGLPAHVALIMDGNGRWAKQRNLPRVEGHRHGAESVRAVVRAAGEVGIKYLTLYAFSVENWSRPKEEVDTLMKYLDRYLRNEIGDLQKK